MPLCFHRWSFSSARKTSEHPTQERCSPCHRFAQLRPNHRMRSALAPDIKRLKRLSNSAKKRSRMGNLDASLRRVGVAADLPRLPISEWSRTSDNDGRDSEPVHRHRLPRQSVLQRNHRMTFEAYQRLCLRRTQTYRQNGDTPRSAARHGLASTGRGFAVRKLPRGSKVLPASPQNPSRGRRIGLRPE